MIKSEDEDDEDDEDEDEDPVKSPKTRGSEPFRRDVGRLFGTLFRATLQAFWGPSGAPFSPKSESHFHGNAFKFSHFRALFRHFPGPFSARYRRSGALLGALFHRFLGPFRATLQAFCGPSGAPFSFR